MGFMGFLGKGCDMDCTFGPVPSRRLGRSLGVDLVPRKKCSYDCVYCQLGRTTEKTVERTSWCDPDEIVEQVRRKLDTRPDYITLAGSGEPTLNADLGVILRGIKSITEIPVAVLTNGSLLWREDVRRELAPADLVLPSLDAASAKTFQQVNRPHESLSFQDMIMGLVSFRQGFKGRCWLEIMLLTGQITNPDEIQSLVRWVKLIQPDRVHLNTVVRPPAEPFALPVSVERLTEFAALFDPPAEVISAAAVSPGEGQYHASSEDILEMLKRRPCSIEDIAVGLDMPPGEVVKCIEILSAQNRITFSRVGEEGFYSARG